MYGALAPVHSQEDMAKFREFVKWILKNAPEVAKMKLPFSFGQYLELKAQLPKEQGERPFVGKWKIMALYWKKNDPACLTIRYGIKRDYNSLKMSNNAISDIAAYLREREMQTK